MTFDGPAPAAAPAACEEDEDEDTRGVGVVVERGAEGGFIFVEALFERGRRREGRVDVLVDVDSILKVGEAGIAIP